MSLSSAPSTKVSTSHSLDPVHVLPYTAKGLCRCDQKPSDGEMGLDYLDKPDVITRVLVSERGS